MFQYVIEFDDPYDDEKRPFSAMMSLLETLGIRTNILIVNSMGVHPRQIETIHKLCENFSMVSFYQDPADKSSFCLLFSESISDLSDVLYSLHQVELCVYPLTDFGMKEGPEQILKKSASKILKEKLAHFSCILDQSLCLHLTFDSNYYTLTEVSELLRKWEFMIHPDVHVFNQMSSIPHRLWVTWNFS